jgi:glycosyltransferase involved in cell wall biosynthesis
MAENTPKKETVKVALVHDFLLTMGGAERVLKELSEMYPTAPIYTLLSDKQLTQRFFQGKIVKESFLQNFPEWMKKRYKWLLPFYSVAAESLNLRDYDLIISSSGAWTKGIVTRLHTKHIAYIHSPMRYVWDSHEEYLEALKKKRNFLLRGLLSYLRVWDFEAAQRPEVLVANSLYTQRRIEKYYRRSAELVYPALSLQGNDNPVVPVADRKPYFLLVSRLTRIKKVDVVVEAFTKLGFPLYVVGTGPEKEALQKKAGENITFLGFVPDEQLAGLYQEARALIFPSEEDFGLTAAEAHSYGTPVIAFEYGGIQEIVEPGVTGELFGAKTHEVISEAVLRFTRAEHTYSTEAMKNKAAQFTSARFQEQLKTIINTAYGASRT